MPASQSFHNSDSRIVGKAKRAKRNLKPGGMKKPEPRAMQKSQVLSYKSGPGFLINSLTSEDL